MSISTQSRDGGGNPHYISALAITFLGGFGLGVVVPMLPFLVLHFDKHPAIVTQLVAVYAIAGVVGGPLLGRASDRFGRKTVVVASLVASLLSYLGMLATWTLAGIFAFRFLGGFATGRSAVLRALVTDYMDAEHHVSRLSTMAATSAIGTAAGPLLGGLIATMISTDEGKFRAILWFCTAVTALSIAAFLLLTDRRQMTAQSKSEPRVDHFYATLRALWQPFILTATTSFAYGVLFSVTALLVKVRFGWGVYQTGILLGAMASFLALARTILLPWLSRCLGITQTLGVCIVTGAASLLAVGFATSPIAFVAAFVPCTCACGLATVIPSILVSMRAEKASRGYAMGLCQSFGAVSLAIAASGNGFLFEFIGPWAPHAAGASILLAGFAVGILWPQARLMAATLSQ